MARTDAPLPDRLRETLGLAWRALRSWTPRQVLFAILGSAAIAAFLGIATVLIPNPLFARDIPPVWWNYPVWILTSIMSGMLIATYVRRPGSAREKPSEDADASERRSSRLGMAGAFAAWFAVGCPVCNKIALLALGYSGAITWFAPVQPFLAIAALAFTTAALIGRLRGQVLCPVRTPSPEAVR